MAQFCESFWETDIVGTTGFDQLIKRVKDGNNVCKDIEDFLKLRAKAEQDYSKSLQRISSSAKGKEEIGGLRNGWDELVKQTERMSVERSRLGGQLYDVGKKIEEFKENQKEVRKKKEEFIKKAHQVKRDAHSKVVQCKRTYEQKCKEADQAAEAATRQENAEAHPKEKEKATKKRESTKLAAQTADQLYKEAVTKLEEARSGWEEQMVIFCNAMQKSETERIVFLRNAMWNVTNICSEHCVVNDELQEAVRKVLEQCIVENDLKLFVSQKGTGKVQPAPVNYENYYGDNSLGHSSAHNSHSSTGAPSVQISSWAQEPLPSIPQAEPPKQSNDSLYASVDSFRKPESQDDFHPFRAEVMYAYQGQGPNELSIAVGQIVEVQSKLDSNWWNAVVDGKHGIVPSRYCQQRSAFV